MRKRGDLSDFERRHCGWQTSWPVCRWTGIYWDFYDITTITSGLQRKILKSIGMRDSRVEENVLMSGVRGGWAGWTNYFYIIYIFHI